MLRFLGSFLIFGGLLGLAYAGLMLAGVIRSTDTAPISPPAQEEIGNPPLAAMPDVVEQTTGTGSDISAVDEPIVAVPDSAAEPPSESTTASEAREPPVASAPRQAAPGSGPREPAAAPRAPTDATWLAEPITWVHFPRLGINVEVVPSKFVYVAQGGTWQVPAFKVGHAEFTGGAGQVGNAVLLGHVASRGLGNVFQNLEGARAGDLLDIASRSGGFKYQVVDVLRVPRTEVSVLHPTDVPTISLITCTGLWLANLQDYAERIVVRGQLVQDS